MFFDNSNAEIAQYHQQLDIILVTYIIKLNWQKMYFTKNVVLTSDAIKIEPNSLVFYYCGWLDF